MRSRRGREDLARRAMAGKERRRADMAEVETKIKESYLSPNKLKGLRIWQCDSLDRVLLGWIRV